MNSLDATEKASSEVATQPRITKRYIEEQIARVIFTTGDSLIAGSVTPADDPGDWVKGDEVVESLDAWQPMYAHHTVCLLTTKAGFTVIGHSAPASAANFELQLGRQLAYENAFRQLWPLFAFAALEFTAQEITYGDFGQEF